MRRPGVQCVSVRCRGRSRRGLTLVEALAACLLVGTSVTTLLVAQGRALEQLHGAGRQLAAAELAHELILEWRLTGVDLRTETAGTIDAAAGWTWRRWSEVVTVSEDVRARRVTLELICQTDAPAYRPWRRSFHWLSDDDGT